MSKNLEVVNAEVKELDPFFKDWKEEHIKVDNSEIYGNVVAVYKDSCFLIPSIKRKGREI